MELTTQTPPPIPAIWPDNASPTVNAESQPEVPCRRKWTRAEYYRLAEQGFFLQQRAELIDGEIINMAAMNGPHRTSIVKADRKLQRLFAEGFFVTVQCPLSIGAASDPEPDVAVIAGEVDDFTNTHPTTAVLIIEVAETSLRFDRNHKGSLYAQAGVPDYWILNLPNRRLEVRRRPVADENALFGFSYAELTVYAPDDTVAPLAKPETQILVSDLLP